MSGLSLLRRIFFLLLSLPCWFLGLIFFISAFAPQAAAQGLTGRRLFFGFFLAFLGLIFTVFALIPMGGSGGARSQEDKPSQQEPSGQVELKSIKCTHCGAFVDAGSAKLSAEGTMSYSCPYCGGTFLLEEAPKW